MKRITQKAWFGPKQYAGWGFSPRSWEGWTVLAVFIALLLIDACMQASSVFIRVIVALALIALFLLIMAITSDRPGGPALDN